MRTVEMLKYESGQSEACYCIRSWNLELISSVATEVLIVIDLQFTEQLWHERLNGLDMTSDDFMVPSSVSRNGLI
jgi:hypothetical protein